MDERPDGFPFADDLDGYAQAVKVADTILDHSNMEAQMRQTYRNAEKILAAFGASLDDVILVTPRLALPTQLVEIKFIAKVR